MNVDAKIEVGKGLKVTCDINLIAIQEVRLKWNDIVNLTVFD